MRVKQSFPQPSVTEEKGETYYQKNKKHYKKGGKYYKYKTVEDKSPKTPLIVNKGKFIISFN